MIWLLVVESTVILGGLAHNSWRLRKVLLGAREDAMDGARTYLKSVGARALIAKAARSVAKDYLQEQAEARGEAYHQ